MIQHIQPYDLLMLAVLVSCILFGVWKGMAWQVAALASVVVSGIIAVHGSQLLTPYFQVNDPWGRIFAMLVLYVVASLVIWLLFRLVKGAIDRVQLKEFDRQLGAMFGLFKGLLYCVLITFFTVTLSESARQVVLMSRSGEYIARGIRKTNPILPADIHALLGKYIDQLDERLHAPVQPSQTAAGGLSPSGLGQASGEQGSNSTTGGAGGAGQSPSASQQILEGILRNR
jgi:membrane protein required for colicin V production